MDWNALTLDSIQESISESTRIYLDKLDAYIKMRSHVRELGLFINVVGDIYKPYSSVTTVRADTD